MAGFDAVLLEDRIDIVHTIIDIYEIFLNVNLMIVVFNISLIFQDIDGR